MRERVLSALLGAGCVAITYALVRLPAGWFVAAAVFTAVGWLTGGYIRRLNRQATRDELTGVANRRPFERLLTREWERAVRYHRPLSMLFIDVDDFGAVNKQFGHLVGDEALRSIARQLRLSVRKTDTVARWGGEEFVVLLPETDVDQALILAERIRCVIAQHIIRDGEISLQLTISTGVSGIPGSARHPRELLRQAVTAEGHAKFYKNAVRCVS